MGHSYILWMTINAMKTTVLLCQHYKVTRGHFIPTATPHPKDCPLSHPDPALLLPVPTPSSWHLSPFPHRLCSRPIHTCIKALIAIYYQVFASNFLCSTVKCSLSVHKCSTDEWQHTHSGRQEAFNVKLTFGKAITALQHSSGFAQFADL